MFVSNLGDLGVN